MSSLNCPGMAVPMNGTAPFHSGTVPVIPVQSRSFRDSPGHSGTVPVIPGQSRSFRDSPGHSGTVPVIPGQLVTVLRLTACVVCVFVFANLVS